MLIILLFNKCVLEFWWWKPQEINSTLC